MISTIISAVLDSVIKGIFGWISDIMEKRGLIDQGRKEQHSADLEQEVRDASQAAKIQSEVQRSSDATVDLELEQLRKSSGGK